MKLFLDADFLLESELAVRLYHEFAADLPIIDYHCHLSPSEIALNRQFNNLTEIWLKGDHYKWRAMRTAGFDESYITGEKSDWEKFEKWAETVPYTLRNPLYHWTHLELKRYFGIHALLSPKTAKSIYEDCNRMLQSTDYCTKKLIEKMRVEVICTTDDPLDNLEFHKILNQSQSQFKVYPAFRPDLALKAENTQALNQYIGQLEKVTDLNIESFEAYLIALKKRHTYFAENHCTVSDHGLEQLYAEDYTLVEINQIFDKILSNKILSTSELLKFKSALLYEFALWDHEKGWVQQYHLGALRNNNFRAYQNIGPDSGFDSMGDFRQARGLSRFLNRLDQTNQLTRTIIYNLNPSDNALFASMIGNFNDGTIAGKIQFGSAWWFLDQKQGIINQLDTLSNMGLISKMVGMLTDSRSFLSFPRHEYFRRILCNLFAKDIINGELPNDLEWVGKVIQDIGYNNAKSYFSFYHQ